MGDFPPSSAGFATTRWTLIADAAGNATAMNEFVSQYWSAVYSFYRRSGLQRADAADLTQGFLTDAVLDGALLSKADSARGRFRALLKTAARNYLIDQRRRELRHARRPDESAARRWNEHALDAAEPRINEDPGDAFDRQYAATVVNLALQQMERACERADMSRQWTVFDERMLRPARGGEATPVPDLADRLGARTSQEVYSINQAMNRKFDTVFMAVIAQTVDRDDEVDDEKRAILGHLGVAQRP